MKNIWTRYLEPISVEEAERKPFLQQLQKFEEHSHFNMQELPVAEPVVEESFETVSEISQDKTEELIVPEMPDERVETVEVVNDSAEEIDFIPELTPELAPELAPEPSLEMQPLEVEDEIPQLLELEVPAMTEEVPAVVEEMTIVVEGEPSELLDDVTEVVQEDVVAVEYTGEGTEIMCWVAKSHKGHDMRLNTYPDDVVRLVEYGAGKLLLKYSITGEDIEDTPVASVEEAEDIIDEDNAMTEDLYLDAPGLKWVKVTEYE